MVLSRLERSPIAILSLAFMGWRTVMTFVFYEDAGELARLGYSTERTRHRRLALVPTPTESGVRLKDDLTEVEAPVASGPDVTVEAEAAPNEGAREVA